MAALKNMFLFEFRQIQIFVNKGEGEGFHGLDFFDGQDSAGEKISLRLKHLWVVSKKGIDNFSI